MNDIRDKRYDELRKRLSREKVFSVIAAGKKQGQERGNETILKSVCRICGIDKTQPAAV